MYKFQEFLYKALKILRKIRKGALEYDHPKLKKTQIDRKRQARAKMAIEAFNEIKKLTKQGGR